MAKLKVERYKGHNIHINKYGPRKYFAYIRDGKFFDRLGWGTFKNKEEALEQAKEQIDNYSR